MTVSFVEPVDLLLPLIKYSVGLNRISVKFVSLWCFYMGTYRYLRTDVPSCHGVSPKIKTIHRVRKPFKAGGVLFPLHLCT